jgi:LacI family transcriptional regulator
MGLFVSISIETEDMTPFKKLQESGVPVVFFDRVAEVSGFNKVCLADEEVARIAAQSIIAKGKKNVLALFGHPHLSITKLRYTSFKNYFEVHAKDTIVDYYFPEQVETSREVCLEVFRNKIPEAVFCMGDMILMGVMHAVHESKLNVPEDISIIGISNGLIPTLYEPKITYVETSGFKLGQLAFKQMYASLKGFKEPEEVILDSILVEGGSL